jgi:hypothetical protein
MSNTKLWDLAFTTLPSAVKPITGKQYQGNSPKPYWIVQRLTELLGPCGIGWGMQIVQERFERLSEDDVLHVATVRLWYVLDGVRGEFEQMGQTKATYRTSKGALMIDEDSPKKSVTDALVKCASYLGFAGDIFSGRWDDSNYVNELRKEEAEAKKKPDHVATLPEYASSDLEKNLPAWQAMANDGKFSADNLIAKISTRYTMSAAQQSVIRSIKPNVTEQQPACDMAEHAEFVAAMDQE